MRSPPCSAVILKHCSPASLSLVVAVAFALCSSPCSGTCRAAENAPSPEQIQYFEKHVRPLLIEHCAKCHGEERPKGGLRVDSRGHLLLGGESGPSIEPGNSGKSLLMEAVRYESFEMPPAKKLSDQQIEILAKWIDMGAPWPGDDGKVAIRTDGDKFSEADRNWWAFQPIKKSQPPEMASGQTWGRNEIDKFIAAEHGRQELTPAPEASRRSLIRRVYFDLTGLPPTPEQIQQFEDSQDPHAYEKIVDELLAKPEYGERWARHWLDLVRYAESDGFRADSFRPEAWRYRDYVIQSLNDDKPYDRFVQEQLAGDELFPNDPSAQVATGFLRHGIYEYNARDARGQWENILNEVTDTAADVFLGMGFQCARCHDHKYDPILQKDYFQLRAFFEPILPHDDLVAATPEQIAEYEARWVAYDEKTRELRAELDAMLQKYLDQGRDSAIGRFPDDIQEMYRKAPSERTPREEQLVQLAWRQVIYEYERVDSRIKGEAKDQVLALRRKIAAFDAIKPPELPRPMLVRDVGSTPPKTIIPKRGIEVTAGFPSILEPELPTITPPENVPNTTGRRAALAKWITRPENPITNRVIVNRIWQYHFGKGLVTNSSDFGRLGDPPSHPELLDWLTARFIERGSRFKDLHRLIVTSATYRQSANHPQLHALQLKDPSNRYYWRGETRRLDAEQIRDAIFAVTGQLKTTRGGPSVLPDQPRRSIYARVMRNARDPLLDAFDLPQFFSGTSSRDTTTSPVQSLLLINSQTMLAHAGKLASEVQRRREASGDTAADISRLWWRVFGREPDLHELKAAQQFLENVDHNEPISKKVEAVAKVKTGKVPYRDGQAVLFQDQQNSDAFIVPADERLNVGDFTIEAYFQIRSVYDSGAVRTIATASSGRGNDRSWMFGITGKGSRRKPQTLVLQMYGTDTNGTHREAALFSDHHLELNKPYYAAVTVRLAQAAKTGDRPEPAKPGIARFYLKDLSNDDEPLLTAEMPVPIVSEFNSKAPLFLGAQRGKTGRFDGLIDDIRLSRGALPLSQLLYTSEGATRSTIGYWQFEPTPGVFRNTIPEGLHLQMSQGNDDAENGTSRSAFVDLCHVLLNSNEFLYVD